MDKKTTVQSIRRKEEEVEKEETNLAMFSLYPASYCLKKLCFIPELFTL